MKITSVTATSFAHPMSSSSACLVQVNAGPELAGIAIGYQDLRASVTRLADELLLGEDPRGVAAIWQQMTDARVRDTHPDVTRAAAILDIALWDLKAKANHEPLWKALGGSRPRVNVHFASGPITCNDEALLRRVETLARDHGVSAVKLDVGSDRQVGLRRLDLVRRALESQGATPTLMLDACETWSPKEAVRTVRAIEREFDLTWVESPTARGDFLGLKRVSNAIRAAVCAGKGLEFPQGYLPYFNHRAFDVVQIDTARCGITGAMQLADAAFGFELPVALCDSPGNLHAHLAGALPYCMSMEISRSHFSGVFDTDVRIERGRAIAGDRHGNGIEVDAAALADAAAGRRVA